MNPNEESKEKGFSMDDVLVQAQVVFRRFRLVTLCACLVLAGGLIYYCYARPLYKAVSSAEVVSFNDITLRAYQKRYFNQRPGFWDFKKEVPSRAIALKAAKSLGINMGYNGIRKNYINRARVYLDHGSPDFNQAQMAIEVLSYDEDIGKKWARALVEEYIIHRKQNRDTKATFLLEQAKNECEETAHEVQQMKAEKLRIEQDNHFADLQNQWLDLRFLPRNIARNRVAIQEMDRVILNLSQPGLTRTQQFSILSRYKINPQLGGEVHDNYQSNPEEPDPDRPHISTVIHVSASKFITPDESELENNWMKLEERYKKFEKELNLLSLRLGPGHPERKALQEKVNRANDVVETEFQNRKKAFEFYYAQQVAKRTQLLDKVPQYNLVYKKIQQVGRLLKNMEAKIKDQQRRQNRLHKTVETIQQAYLNDPIIEISYLGLKDVSDGSISPNKGKLLVYCMGGALLLGISMAYLLEYMDSSVKAPENVEMELQIYGLGIVPELNAKGDVDLLQVHEAFPMFKESFRVIRTNLILRRDDMGRGQIMMLSSSMPQEGKSLCSLELARSFAELGDRTLLIDADLRRGKQTRKLTGKKVAGLADFLTGKAQVEPVQFEENLDFLPAGHYSNQAIESLGGQAFTALIMGFRMQYSQIIVDGPPLLGLPDVFMMKDCIDGMVVVVSAGHTAFPQLRLAVEQVQKSRIPVHGFILNRVNFRTGGKYYRYYYRNYEYYHQGSEGQATVIPHAS